MSEQDWIDLIAQMQKSFVWLDRIKAHPDWADSRGIAIAMTHLETALLWVAHAKKP